MYRKRMAVLLTALILLVTLVLPCAATEMEYDGLEVTVVTDKEQYDPGEAITATITVENTGSQSVTIASLEQLIPEGYVLSEGSDAVTEDIELSPGEGMSMNVTFVGGEAAEEKETEDFFKNLIEGETFGLPNLLLLVVAVIAVAIFMWLT